MGDTPVRMALREDSALTELVQEGLGALLKPDKQRIHVDVRTAFADSLALDEGLVSDHPSDNRWDYLLGHETANIVGVEVHSAKSSEVSVVIAKRQAAKEQLKAHFAVGARVERWLWVASGRNQIQQLDKARFRLSQAGIALVGSIVSAKDLP